MMLEPPYVYDDYPDVPEHICFDCGNRWVPDGYWDCDDGRDVYIPDSDVCPWCGSDDTDEYFGPISDGRPK